MCIALCSNNQKCLSACLSVCSFLSMHVHSFKQICSLHKTWHVASLSAQDGHGGLASAAHSHELALQMTANRVSD